MPSRNGRTLRASRRARTFCSPSPSSSAPEGGEVAMRLLSEARESSYLVYNPSAASFSAAAEPTEALAFHRKLPGCVPTPLVAAPHTAARLGVARVWVKD